MIRKFQNTVNRYSKGIVLLCILMTTLYTLDVLLMCWSFETLPPTELTVGVFGMYSVEFGALAAIKVKDNHKENEDEDSEEADQ